MSDGNNIIRRLTEGGSQRQEVERHDVIVRQADGPNPPDLLPQIISDIRDSLAELTPIAGKAVGKYVEAKGDQAVARVQEIRARIYESIGKLELERQRQIQERDEAINAHAAKMKELEIQRFRERKEALRAIVDCVVKLREQGISIDMRVVGKQITEAMTELLETE